MFLYKIKKHETFSISFLNENSNVEKVNHTAIFRFLPTF